MNAQPMINFFDALKNCFRNYINFKGRIRRSEYWWFMLPINVVSALLIILLSLYASRILGISYTSSSSGSYPYNPSPYNTDYPSPSYDPYPYIPSYTRIKYDKKSTRALIIIFVIHISCIALPVISATVRRLHDVGKKGNYIFIGFVPFFGGLTLLILLCLDSHQNSNKFGPSPKYGNGDLDKNTELNPLTNEIITTTDNKIDTLLN